jgi:ribosomal protein S12 methylthiotransferase accessory factor
MSPAPRLIPEAQIIPSAAGLLALVGGRLEVISVGIDGSRQESLLELLRAGSGIDAIRAETGLGVLQSEAVVDRLAQLGLVSTESAPATFIDPSSLFPPAQRVAPPNEPDYTVLLVGLGRLGLVLLRSLLQFSHFRLRLFDPTEIEPHDVSPWYRPEDLGRAKSEIVARWLGAAKRAGARPEILRRPPPARLDLEVDEALAPADVVVCCLDQPSALASRLAAACRPLGTSLVVTQLVTDGAVIDPVAAPNTLVTHGCANCATLYRADTDPWALAIQPFLAARFPRPAPWRHRQTPEQIAVVADLACLALRRALDIRAGRRFADGRATRVNFDRWTVDAPAVPKHYACRLCFPLLAPPSESLTTRLRSAASPVEPVVLAERLRPLVGAPYGLFEPPHRPDPVERQAIFNAFRRRGVEPLHNPLANAYRVTGARRIGRRSTIQHQFSEYLAIDDSRTAEAIAMVEGLERLFTMDYCPPERIVQGTYGDLEPRALDPRSLPLYAPEQYDEPGFPLQRFSPHEPLRWIEGVSLEDGQPRLVPLDFVCSTSEPAIYHATSSGAACHGSLSQAVVNAVYETVERDAFVVAWLNRLSLPRVDVAAETADPFAVRDTLRRLGFELTVVDLTMDLEIPVLLGVLRDRHNPDFLLVDMVARLDPQQALTKLCRELAQFCRPYLRTPSCFESELTRESDPSKVWTFPDHLAFYQAREKQRYADFLTASTQLQSMRAPAGRTEGADSRHELERLSSSLARRGYHVVVVDCTVPMLARLGLHAVKVVIPGLHPLNAGHRRRILGGARLYRLPVEMGFLSREHTLAELNPWPHPFW